MSKQQIQKEEELLLQNSNSNINKSSNRNINKLKNQDLNSSSQSEQQSEGKSEGKKSYYQKQEKKIQQDQKDLERLKLQIDKVKKLKSQKNELDQLTSDLRSENQNLKLQKQSIDLERRSLNRENQRMKSLNQQEENNNKPFSNTQKKYLSNQKKPLSNYGQEKGSQFQKNLCYKFASMRQHEQNQERFLSPQITKKPIRKNNLNLEGCLNSIQQRSYLEDPRILMHKYHLQNKKTVIGSFVDELKDELQHSESLLQKQKRSHRDTKSKLDETLIEVNHLRQKIHRSGEYDSVVRTNQQLRFQLELQVEQRLLAQQKIRQKELVLSKYEQVFLRGCRQYEDQLQKMDEIYLKTQKFLGIL